MSSTCSKKSRLALIVSMLLFVVTALSACNSQPPKLMEAVKQFDTEKELQEHLSHIRKDHMDLLRHKRDETMIRGIRTKENSLRGCIDCHVPAQHNGKVLRHEDPEHFCATCHNYVAADPDCFQCHVDHPVSESSSASNESSALTKKTEKTSKTAVTTEVSKSVALVDTNPHSGEASSE
jgi:hypothetical protein